ncbi:hypothetical protein IFM89_039534 [Coptis chinensis]|uniref:Uncharacterized protein n=1 Tax=Coptis chinensis TaxID=261450 RepID=A0A835GWI3_9MAGN|nr:hypothetical protein IFM89_039534 [Coptis chinensis]
MSLSLCQSSFSSPFQEMKYRRDPSLVLLPKSLFPGSEGALRRSFPTTTTTTRNGKATQTFINASLIENPVVWASRLCIYYALLKAGLVGSPASPIFSDSQGSIADLGFSKWLEGLQGRSEEKEATDRRKLVRNWHPTTKGTLKRSYRVPSKSAGQRLLKGIASLLSDDDQFIDADLTRVARLEEKVLMEKVFAVTMYLNASPESSSSVPLERLAVKYVESAKPHIEIDESL